MQQGNEEQNALRTRVYIDGYNLYYGCLKRSFDKWLDPRALVECILPSVLYERNGEPIRYRFHTPAIKYFTAPILKRSAGAARKWLNQPCVHLRNRIPIDMCSQDGSVQELRAYMDRYAKEFGV